MINVFMDTDIKTYDSNNPNSRQQPAMSKATPATGNRIFVSYPVLTNPLSHTHTHFVKHKGTALHFWRNREIAKSDC